MPKNYNKMRKILNAKFLKKHKKPIVITTSIVILQVIFGFDPKFFIINIVWLFV